MTKFAFYGEFAKDKNLKSANLDELVAITFSETDVDRMLTQVAERMVKNGEVSSNARRTLGGRPLESLNVSDFAGELQKKAELQGFFGNRGAEVLEGWLRSTVVIVKGQGKARTGESIDYLAPLTAATYRTGFPKNAQRHRRADRVIWELMVGHLSALGQTMPSKSLLKYCQTTIGQGVDFGFPPYDEPKYDGVTDLDINHLFALRFVELFDATGLRNKAEKESFAGTAVPGALFPLAQDLVSLFQVASGEGSAKSPRPWEAAEVFSALRSVIAIRLLQVPLRMAQAVREVLSGRSHPDLWPESGESEEQLTLRQWTNPLEIYCDFTNEADSDSERLGKLCVSRDLDSLRAFFADRMLFRAVTLVAPLAGHAQVFGKGKPRRAMLDEVVRAQTAPEYLAAATTYLQMLSGSLENEAGEPLDDEVSATFEEVMALYDNPIQALARLLVLSRESAGVEGLTKWMRATGGLQNAGLPAGYALLSGQEGRRTSWRYRPSEELIFTVIDMCFIDPGTSPDKRVARERKQMPLEMLLKRLRERYGLLIHEPPRDFDTPENRAGANKNLRAFQAVLRDFGCFDSLSDDFSAQVVRRPRRV